MKYLKRLPVFILFLVLAPFLFSGCANFAPTSTKTTTYTIADGHKTILADGSEIDAKQVKIEEKTPTGPFGKSDYDSYTDAFKVDRAARKDMVSQCGEHFKQTAIPATADAPTIALISMSNNTKSLLYKECTESVARMPFGLKKPRTLQDNIGTAISTTPIVWAVDKLANAGKTSIDNRKGTMNMKDSLNQTHQTIAAGQNGTASGAITAQHDNPITNTTTTTMLPAPTEEPAGLATSTDASANTP